MKNDISYILKQSVEYIINAANNQKDPDIKKFYLIGYIKITTQK